MSMCNGDIASKLKARYNDKRMACWKKGKIKPAYQCSGLLIRGVNNLQKLTYPWSLKPENKARDSFSVAFLRKDTRFSSFPHGYDSGFIISPHLQTKARKNTYKVFCAFPLNSHSDGRKGHGCGRSDRDPSGTSGHCDSQGINSFNKWVAHYSKIENGRGHLMSAQCAFDMTKRSAAADFALTIRANTYIRDHSTKYSCRNNELLIHGWNESNAKSLPIEAFFYLKGFRNAYERASQYQDQYYQKSGEVVPIVGITLPTKSKADIGIVYKHRTPRKGHVQSVSREKHQRRPCRFLPLVCSFMQWN